MPCASVPTKGTTVVDAVLAVLLLVLAIDWGWAAAERTSPAIAAIAVGLPVVAVLVTGTRRRGDPIPVAVALTVASIAVSWASGAAAWSVLAPAALFMVAAHESRPRRRTFLVVTGVVALGIAEALTAVQWVEWVLAMVLLVAMVGWARGLRVRQLYEDSLRARAEAAERERDLRAAQAVAEERTRIARDIHDLVSHSLAAVAMQAGGAQRIAQRDPARAAQALGTIAETARGALTEMRALLLVLRSPDGGTRAGVTAGTGEPGEDAPASRPSPGLADLSTVVSGMADLGLAVEARTSGEPFALRPGAQLAVHRLVAEALTNALKHGGRSRPVRLDLDYRADALAVTVASPLPSDDQPRDTVPGSGTGLLGMRERLAVYGGTAESGPVGDDWVVRAVIPREQDGTWAIRDTPPQPTTPEHVPPRGQEGSP